MADSNAPILAEPSAPLPRPLAAPRFLFAQGAFLCLFLGSLAGKLGERLYQMAIIVAVMKAFKDTSDKIPLITLAGVLPQFFLYPLVGRLVDSVDRRRLLWGTCALSALVVWGLLPILWLDPKLSPFQQQWTLSLFLVFALSLIVVPFGPARVSAIPDVVGPEQTGIAASIVATSGLVAILLGSVLGGFVADRYGAANVIPVSCALFLAGAALMRSLPARAAVPGVQRGDAAAAAPAASASGFGAKLLAYGSQNWEGIQYCARTKGVFALILFETTFWLCAVSFYNLCDWHASMILNLPESGRVFYFSVGLGCAGVGLFAGALLIGKFSRKLSPLLTYAPAYLCIGMGMWAVFETKMPPNPDAAVQAFAERFQKVEVLDALPEMEREALRVFASGIAADPEAFDRNRIERTQREGEAVVLRLLGWLFLLGLGGGMMLGRVDADMLVLTTPSMRGRVFSIKGFFFTGALLLPLLLFWLDRRFDSRLAISFYVPIGLMLAAFPVLYLSWILDCGMYAERRPIEEPGPAERGVFRFARFISWLIFKVYFRHSVVGAEKIPAHGPVILAANHGSFLDPIWLGCGCRRPVQYMVHNKYYRGLGHPFFRFMSCIPVDASSKIAALKSSAQALSQGIVIGIFPEGHVSDDGQLQKPEGGAPFLAKRTGAPIFPCAILGNTRAYPRWLRFPRPHKITIVIGDPIVVPKDASREQLAEYTDQIMAALGKMLGLPAPPAG